MVVKDYPIKTSEDEFTRLSMQPGLFRGDAEFILDRIGVKPGWRCLDLCCGIAGLTRAGRWGEESRALIANLVALVIEGAPNGKSRVNSIRVV